MNTTDLTPLPPRPNLEQYKKQAKDFIKLAKAGDPQTLRRAQEQGRESEMLKNVVRAMWRFFHDEDLPDPPQAQPPVLVA